MGSLILASITAGVVWIMVGLLNAWLRAEVTAWSEIIIKRILSKASEMFPEEERANVLAEALSINSVRIGPTMKLVDACSFFLSARRSARELSPVTDRLNWFGSKREERLAMLKMGRLSVLMLICGLVEHSVDFYSMAVSGWFESHRVTFFMMQASFLMQAAGGVLITDRLLKLRHTRKLFWTHVKLAV